MSDLVTLVFDMKEMKPACAILQAVFGGDPGIASCFDSRFWLVNPTPDMKPYLVPRSEMPAIIKRVEELHANKKED